jgi:hypothetical protein
MTFRVARHEDVPIDATARPRLAEKDSNSFNFKNPIRSRTRLQTRHSRLRHLEKLPVLLSRATCFSHPIAKFLRLGVACQPQVIGLRRYG